MPTLLIVHHTPSPALHAMFEAAADGARTDEVEGVDVVVRPALTASEVDVLAADGYLLGTPVTLALGTRSREPAGLQARPYDQRHSVSAVLTAFPAPDHPKIAGHTVH
jgi:hypothetical protein